MAGLGRRVFTPGEVLTATNVMGYLQDQAVMNFAGTAARGSAIGTAVSEGMVSYLADSNVVQAYDGSAWNSLAYSSSVTAPEAIGIKTVIPASLNNSSGSASYNSTTGLVTFTGVSSLSLNGVFTSTYRNYRLNFNITSSSGSPGGLLFRLRNAGTDRTSANYYTGGLYGQSNGATGSYSVITSFGDMGYIYSSADSYSAVQLEIKDPKLAIMTKFISSMQGLSSTPSGVTYNLGMLHNIQESHDGITLWTSAGTLITGEVKVYGWN